MTATVEKMERADPAHVVPHQGLPGAPAGVPVEWGPVNVGALEPAVVWAPAPVRMWTEGQRLAAKADAEAHPAIAALGKVGAQFEGATKAARDAMAALDADFGDAVKLTPASHPQLKALLAPKYERAQREAREAVDTWRGTFDGQLAAAEKEAEAKVATLGRTSPDAQAHAFDFMASLASLTPGRAMDAVLGLATEVAEGRARAERATALLPALASAIERVPGFNTDEMRAVLRVLEAASRDRAWYAAHATLAKVRSARVKLGMFAEQWLDEAFHGRGPYPSVAIERADGTRASWYADLGAATMPEGARLARVDAYRGPQRVEVAP